MADKNVVDDYYSQMKSSKDEGKGNKSKVVVKKKIIVKKPKIVLKKDLPVS